MNTMKLVAFFVLLTLRAFGDIALLENPVDAGKDQKDEIFTAIFKDAKLTKDGYETQAEYSARIDALGLSGKQFTFLSDQFDIDPDADTQTYKIRAKGTQEAFRPASEIDSIVIMESQKFVSTNLFQNGFGATFSALEAEAISWRISVGDISTLRSGIIDNEGPRYGIVMTLKSPPKNIVELLKRGEILIGYRGTTEEVTRCKSFVHVLKPTIESPVFGNITTEIIPVTLSEVFLVDRKTNKVLASEKVPPLHDFAAEAKFEKSIENHELEIGMPEEIAQKSWGPPEGKLTTPSNSGPTVSRWNYKSGARLFFENGILKTISVPPSEPPTK